MDADFDRYELAEQATGGAGGVGGAGGMGGQGGTGAAAGACNETLVLNEIQTGSVRGVDDEFVELYNPGACPVPLDPYTLVYRSTSATIDHGVVWSEAGRAIAPGAFFVIAGAGYEGFADAQFPSSMALAAGGAGLALRLSGEIVSRVGWGDATNEFVAGVAAVAPAAGESIGRVPDGADTGNNSADFVVGVPTPGAPNQGP
jgi:hypothetical protein